MAKDNSERVLVLTGGHAATTALAFAQEFFDRPNLKGVKLHWIGSNRSVEARRLPGIEHNIFPKLAIEVHQIHAGRIQRQFTRHSIPTLLKIPVGCAEAFLLLWRIKPQAVLSFGGYAGFPVVLSAWLLNIPVVLHEQTVATGLANKISAFFARKVAISHEESRSFFPGERVVITGNPMLSQIRKVAPKKKLNSPPVVFITGGSRGSQIINKTIEESLPRLLKHYVVVHQTGHIDFDHYSKLKKHMGKLAVSYEVYATIDPLLMGQFYERADIYVGRSGANTVTELLSVKRPAILIPIPWTRYNEQLKNAQKAKDAGVATIIPQERLTADLLVATIGSIVKNWSSIIKQINIPTDRNESASSNLVNLVAKYL